MTLTIKTYSELLTFHTLLSRYNYLKLSGLVGEQTFGYDRYFNQTFYHSKEWRDIRNLVIVRDEGCDLGVRGYEINDRVLIHHMNPISVEDLRRGNLAVLDPEYLVSVSDRTHRAIHFGDESLLPQIPIKRKPGDTKLW